MVSNLALFCLATYLATFQKIGRFFPNHLVTLPLTQQIKFRFVLLSFENSLAYCRYWYCHLAIVGPSLGLKG